MPVRYPAPCRRAVPRQGAQGIWVTDAMLCQAIERYQRLSCRRRLSTHVGPLESRRRLGKRHMTGLMHIPSGSYSPSWHFEVANPGLWQWEPATNANERRERKQKLTPSALFNDFIGWLENSDAAKPFIQPPRDAAVAFAGPAEAIAPIVVEDITTPDTTVRDMTSLEPPEPILKLRARINLLNEVDDDQLYRWAKRACRSIRHRIEEGALSVEGILLAMEPLDWETRARIPDAKVANRLSAKIRRSILSSIEDTYKKDDSLIPQDLWMALSDKICSSKGENHDVQLFSRLMDMMPLSLRSSIPMHQLNSFTQSFVWAQATRHNLYAHWSARATRFANAIQKLSEGQQAALQHSMRQFLQQETGAEISRLRFAWFMIQANDPSLTRQTFIAMYRELVAGGPKPNSMQLWQLLTARLISTGFVQEPARQDLLDTEYKSMSQRWSALVDAMSSSSEGPRELCSYMTGIGEFETLVNALTSPPLPWIRMSTVQTVATACDSRHLALQLYDAIHSRDEPGAKPRHWNWTTWTPYAERIIKDPEIDPSRIWQVLSLTRKDSRPRSPEQKAADIAAKMQLLDKMSQWFTETTHLNDRQALRQVQKCVASQRALTKGISPQTLKSVVSVVTRDLERGQWGRTARMEWVVGLVAETHGTNKAEKAAEALKGWRWIVDRVRKDA